MTYATKKHITKMKVLYQGPN